VAPRMQCAAYVQLKALMTCPFWQCGGQGFESPRLHSINRRTLLTAECAVSRLVMSSFFARGFATLPGGGASLHPHPLKTVPGAESAR
jgi:hypothetical protein